MIRQLTLAALLLAAAVPANATDGARNSPPPRKAVQVDVFGDDPCPKGVGDEIVVCARLPESERFRIPAPLRRVEVRAQGAVVGRADTRHRGDRARPASEQLFGGRQRRPDRLLREVHARRGGAAEGRRSGEYGAIASAPRNVDGP